MFDEISLEILQKLWTTSLEEQRERKSGVGEGGKFVD